MSEAKTSKKKNDISLGNIILAGSIISIIIIVVLALLGVFSSSAVPSIYKIRLEGYPGKAIQISRMFIKDANNDDVALTTDGSDWYEISQTWNQLENARPDNIITKYDTNRICREGDDELHTTAENRGIWHTMYSADYPDPKSRMKKGEVNFANFKTAEAVDLTGATIYVLGRYHCKHKWPQMGEAFKITVTNEITGKKATVEVPKLRYDEEGYKIQYSEPLVFV